MPVTIPIVDNLIENADGANYIPLGITQKIFKNNKLLNKIADKLISKTQDHVDELWATLGRADDKPINWTGDIVCSGSGNLLSTGLAGREVDLIRSWQQSKAKGDVLEKFISFDDVNFDKSSGSKSLRLTVMLKPGQSAVAFFQHTGENDTNSLEGFSEYIMPSDTSASDRRTFTFDAPDTNATTGNNAKFVAGNKNRFVVKVLTFTSSTQKLEQLYTMGEQCRLLKFNPTKNDFDPVGGAVTIDPTKKTLLLVHGTFSSTAKSYQGLFGANDRLWLQQLLQNGRKYEQVIGFDHYTVIDGPRQNADKFKQLLGPNFKFTKPVDMISTSRGGLVGKTLCNDKTFFQNLIQIEKFAPVACANGVDYFTKAAPKVVQFLNAMKTLGTATGLVSLELIMGALQSTAENFLAQPGMRAMTPGSSELIAIIGTQQNPVFPANSNTRYYPICGDYEISGFHPFKSALDNIIANILGERNDWVVGTVNQAIMPPGYYALGLNADYFLAHTINCTHLNYLKRDKVPANAPQPQELIWDYLHDN